MRLPFILFLGIFLILYGVVNYYIGLRGWQAFGRFLPGNAVVIYWGLVILVASSFFLGMLSRGVLTTGISHGLSLVGFYWLAVMTYLLLAFLVLDLFCQIYRRLGLMPDLFQFLPAAVTVAIIMVAGLVVYGVMNAQHTQVRAYNVEISKDAGEIQTLRAVLISDTHLGTIIDKARVSAMVDLVNEMNPDLVLIAGDIIDGNMKPVIEQQMQEELTQLQATYGVYAVFGNHDYMGGIAAEAEVFLQNCGITVLRDNYQLVADTFYVVGREDASRGTRLALTAILDGVDHAKPVFLLDHQPFNLDEGRHLGVDMQFSGHTHHGQLFPFSLVTGRLFELDWGYLAKGDYHAVVSCGFGTWGPPLRIGSISEIMLVNIHFNGDRR
jgi:predicted MPP superfamily phosphohydrolase